MAGNYRKIHFDRVVGDTVRKLRMEQQMTQKALCEKSGVSTPVLFNVENGMSCPFFVIAQLAEALDCTLDDIAPIAAMMPVTS